MRITSKGQVTIPQAIRERAGFLPGTELEFTIGDDGVVRVARQQDQPKNPALQATIARLRGKADTGMTTEEIMALTRAADGH